MANQMQLEVILAGNRIATRVFVVRTDGQAYGHMITKFSRMGILPHFLIHGAPLPALRARGIRY